MISVQKKIWLQEEDDLLRRFYEDQNIRNWSLISKKLSQELKASRKSAKQCRERYENHISTELAKSDWTIEQEMMLIHYHNEVGNKWALIAQRISGKSDNSVKNHFYSKLRKVLRRLNTIIHSFLRRQFREININIIYKIVQACEQQFKDKPNCQPATSEACRQVQNKMLNLSMLKEEQFDSSSRVEIYREVIREIYAVSKLYKRKSKKSRNNAIQAPVSNKFKRKQEVIIVSNSMGGYDSDRSSVFEDGEEEQITPREKIDFKRDFQEEKQYKLEIPNPQKKPEGAVIIKQQEQGIKDLLKDAGLLQFQKSDVNLSNNGFKFSSRSSFKSYSQKNDSDHQFFEDSDLQKGFYSKKRRSSIFKNIGAMSQKSEGDGPGEFYFNNC